MRENMPSQDSPLGKILDRRAFAWENGEQPAIRDVLLTRAREEAKEKLIIVNNGLALSPKSVLGRVKPRAQSWQIADLMQPYEDDESLTTLNILLDSLSAKRLETLPESEAWLVDALGYETRAALKKQGAAKIEKQQLKKDALAFKISKLKKESDSTYGDALNRLVCQIADKIGEEAGTPTGGRGNMAEADRLAREQVENGIDDHDIEEYLTEKSRKQLETRLQNYYKIGFSKLQNEEKATDFACLIFEIDSRKTNETWQGKKKKFEDAVIAGLQGEVVNLVSILCCINEFDLNGRYTLVPNIDAYRRNPKLEPIPLIIDELAQIADFFTFYTVAAKMNIYVSDTDYAECRQCGPITQENLDNLVDYLKNLEKYVEKFNGKVVVEPISKVTCADPFYQEVYQRISELVRFDDQDFSKEWGRAFEEAVGKMAESQRKKKFLADELIGPESREIIKRIWSTGAAQGAVFGNMPGRVVFVSTERKERDQNYIIDKETRDQFVPVLYILQAADKWTRKLAQYYTA